MSKDKKATIPLIKNPKSVYEKTAAYLVKKKFHLIIIGIGIFLSIINFNARISEAHDDSLYIEAGYKYVHEFPNYYYTSNAPMYPMFLGLLTLLFGTNLIIFKLFSMLFFIAGAMIYYKALDKKVPDVLKYFVLIFICTNHLIIYFSSQTFSEAFYMLIQAIFFYYFLNFNFGTNQFTNDIKLDYKKWLVIGFLMMILTLAKNILIFGIIAIFLFYIFKKDYRKSAFSILSFGLFKLLYEGIKSLIWGASAIQYQSQMGILFNKDPYDASKGQEDFFGFVGRFTDNIGLYLGKRFYQILGFMDEENDKVFYSLAFLILILTFYGLYRAIKDRQYVISFLLLFSGSIAFGTFFVLQARWDQPRFIMVHMPAILLGIFYGIYRLCEKQNGNQRIFLVLVFIISCSLFASSFKRGAKNLPIVSKNLKGDIYYGYTPDWKNYLEISAWCKDSLPESSLVACRKAPMSFVYAKGKHFYPIYSVIAKDSLTQQSNPDSALAIFKRNKVTHILIASLRLNPKQNTGDIINTLHNIAGPIMQKYPEKLKLIKQIGTSEESVIFEIKY
ncbi:MAG: hypothetical protein Q7W45_04825 [Bacteroidota bacterium]|nr:hypothetical protein [Bacteroidota bacterium]MDP3144769.1 hypothetical protein [Bacteroidota bacterium]